MALTSAGCGGTEDREPPAFEVVAQFPHDPNAYTQGLVRADSVLFESIGRYGQSDVRRVDLRSGRVLAARRLAANRVGEGLAILGDRLYQLTWESGVAYAEIGELAFDDARGVSGTWVKESDPYTQIWSLDVD